MRKFISTMAVTLLIAGCSPGNEAAQQAEIEKLRAEAAQAKAETEKLRAEADQLKQQNAERQAEWEANAPSREFERRLQERYFGKSSNK